MYSKRKLEKNPNVPINEPLGNLFSSRGDMLQIQPECWRSRMGTILHATFPRAGLPVPGLNSFMVLECDIYNLISAVYVLLKISKIV